MTDSSDKISSAEFSKNESVKTGDKTDDKKLSRSLTTSSVFLLVISGAIGSGIFMGTGTALLKTGPSILVSYLLAGFLMFFFMRIMGELLLTDLNANSFRDLVEKYLGETAGAIVGWVYWSFWTVICLQDLIAVRGYITMWFPDIPDFVIFVTVLFSFLVFNIFAVKIFGKIESFFGILKLATLTFIVVIGLYFLINQVTFESGFTVNLSNIYSQTPFFQNGFLGFFGGTQLAFTSFVGIELIGTSSAESKEPKKTLPKAVNFLPFIVTALYIILISTVLCMMPYKDAVSVTTPFPIIFQAAGIFGSTVILTVIIILAAVSSANAGVYSTTRMMFSLSKADKAPKVFSKLSKSKVPVNALGLTFCVLLPAVFLVTAFVDVETSYVIATTWAVAEYFIMCIIVCLAYIKYRKTTELHEESVFKAPGSVTTAYILIGIFSMFLISFALNSDSRIGLITGIANVVVIAIFYFRHVKKSRTETNPKEADSKER